MIGPKPSAPPRPTPTHPPKVDFDDIDAACGHLGIGEPHQFSRPVVAGKEPTPGSAAAPGLAARESTGAVVAPGAANSDPSPGSGAPVSPPARGVGHSPPPQVGTAWCGIADVRRAARS